MAFFGSKLHRVDTSDPASDFWDIHNHILPGVDDGSSCLEESFDLIREEYEQGIRNIILTPHYRPGMFGIDAAVREQVYMRFVEKARLEYRDMHFYLGCEVYAHRNMTELFADARCRMADTPAVLMEFSTSGHFETMESLICQTIESGYLPVMAHVERYACLYEDESRICRLRERGALVQVNADTILEGRRSPRRRFVQSLMENEAVDFIASDAHDMDRRPVHMQACIRMVTKQFGRDTADRIFRRNPDHVFRSFAL